MDSSLNDAVGGMIRINALWSGRHLARAAKTLSARSLVAAIEAASVSPTEGHRLSTLMSVFASVVTNMDSGDQPVRPEDYARLMAMAEKEGWRKGMFEPESPLPTQPAVLVEWRGGTFRFLPGANYQAATQFEVIEKLCSVIDPILIENLGYGLGDVAELMLRRIDHVVSSVADAWVNEPPPDLPINHREIEAAASLSCLSTQAEECLHPARAKLALERFTAPPETLAGYPDLRILSVPAVGVWAHMDTEDGRVPLPAGSLMMPLRSIAELLVEKATSINPRIRTMIESEIGDTVFEEMRRFGHPMRGIVALSNDDRRVYLVAEYEGRGVLLVDVGTTIGQSTLKARVKRGEKGVSELVGGANLQATFDATDLVGMDLRCIQVLFSTDTQAGSMNNWTRYEAVDILAFLELLRSLDAPEDLWAVLEDKAELDDLRSRVALADLAEIEFGQGLSLLEVWRIWKDHGKRLSLFALHFSEALTDTGVLGQELAGIAEYSDIERILAKCGQPELSLWPNVFSEESLTVLTDPSTGMYVLVLTWAPPVVMDASRSLVEASPEGYTWELGTWILLRLMAVRDAFISAALDCDLDLLYIRVVKDVAPQTGPMRVINRNASTIVIGWNEECIAAQSADPAFVDMLAGHCLAQCFDSPSSANAAFFRAWKDSAPFGSSER